MGFHDLAHFNDALLAKQAWRLLHNNEILFYKVFKANFFLNHSILEAKESSMGSYAWKSILHGLDVILDGACWRVGNGKSIKILSPMVDTMEEATVDCLIDEGTRTWNATMVDEIFAPQEAEEIKNILLARNEMEDSMYWPWEHDERYSCKTGYRFLKEDEVGFQVAENQDQEKGLWKKIWALECPNKVRNLIWRACRNSLPSKCNLVRRTIISEQSYDYYKEGNEDVLHTVWSCKELDGVWGANSIWSFRNQRCFASFSELLAWVCDHQRNPVLFAFTIWSIWHQRNQVRTQQTHRPLNHLSQWAYNRYMEFKALKTAPITSRPKSRVWWKPPA
ncbi:uncharacterized protein LOC115994578 [Quercus lobata]|uniref:uncharacterized protein LOC115994578 n=1 Tax=Quercus lobata TaxID=97700 RepID=UPI001247AF33|nr:uncharacterized protein LOC115994578 [Quercus lobata]